MEWRQYFKLLMIFVITNTMKKTVDQTKKRKSTNIGKGGVLYKDFCYKK